MTTTLIVKKRALGPYLDNGADNPLWRWLVTMRTFTSGRFRIRGGLVRVKMDSDWFTVAKLAALMSEAKTNFGQDVMDARHPAWMRIALAKAGATVPNWAPVRKIVVDPGDGTTPPTYRQPKFNELPLYRELEGYGWAPCTDGQKYWFLSECARMASEEAGITVRDPKSVPSPDVQPE